MLQYVFIFVDIFHINKIKSPPKSVITR